MWAEIGIRVSGFVKVGNVKLFGQVRIAMLRDVYVGDILGDMPCISLACGISDSTSILCFSLIYTYLRFCAFALLSCTLRFHRRFPMLRHLHRRFPTPSLHLSLHSCTFWRFGPLPRTLCDLPLFPLSCRTIFLSVSPLHPRSWTP